jgi:hypothetical protein
MGIGIGCQLMTARRLYFLVAAVAGFALGAPASALASSANTTATRAYVQANYGLLRVVKAHLPASEAAPRQVLAQVSRECPRAGESSPQNKESTQMSDEVIAAMVLQAARPDLPAIHAFLATVKRLHWSSVRAERAVKSYAAKLTALTTLAAPSLCADVRAWAASGFHSLPASTTRFVALFMPNWVALGELPASLTSYESSQSRTLAARSHQLELEITDAEARAVASWGDIMNELVLQP